MVSLACFSPLRGAFFLALLIVLLVPLNAGAAEGAEWYRGGTGANQYSRSTLDVPAYYACASNSQSSVWDGTWYEESRGAPPTHSTGSDVSIKCNKQNGTEYGVNVDWYRCDDDEDFDDGLEQCVPAQPPQDCSTQDGVDKAFRGSSGGLPSEICSGGCEYTYEHGLSFDDGSWFVAGTGTGQACTGDDTGTESSPGNGPTQSEDPSPTTQTNTDPPVTSQDDPVPGATTTTTESTTTESDPGGQGVTTTSTDITMEKEGDTTKTTTTTTTTTTYPDGTTTTTTHRDVTFSDPGTINGTFDGTTWTFTDTGPNNTSGSSTTTTTTNPDGSSTTNSSAQGDSDGDGKDGEGDEDGDDWTWQKGPPGEFTDLAGDIDQARTDLETAINNVRAEASTFFEQAATGSGGLPCFTWTILGNTTNICLAPYEDELSIIAAFILFLASVLAVRIILSD